MPTSASTGSKSVSTGGKSDKKVEKKADKSVQPEDDPKVEPETVPALDADGEVKKEVPVEKAEDVHQIQPDYAPKPAQTPAQSKGPSQLNSPDGAPIKTDPEDLEPGERADFPPKPPQGPGAGEIADHNDSGIVDAVTRQGAHVTVANADPDRDKKLKAADPKHTSLPRD